MRKYLREILFLILTIGTVFIVTETGLSDYIIPILILLFILSILYIGIKKLRKKDKDLFQGSYTEFYVVTTAILLLIFLTGGINSMFYFLTYFLLFGLSFIFEPLLIFLFLGGLILLFFTQAMTGDLFSNWIRVGSLVLLSPVSYFFGRELKNREKQNK